MSYHPTLQAVNLSFAYATKPVLQNVTVELLPGITGLLGPNGSGKTTLMRVALGLLIPQAGQVRLFGGDPARQPSLRLQAGYLPQSFSPPSNSRVVDYLYYLALLSGIPPSSVHRKVSVALERVGLTERARSRLGSLSGGMLRRVGVAQAILHEPGLLIADEPAVGLDPGERTRLFDGFREMASERPTLISSHSVEELEREAEHVWFLREGRLLWTGSVRDAIKKMRGRVRQGELPQGEQPEGIVVSQKPSADGTVWRVVGPDPRLDATEPSLLDAYFEHMSDQAVT